MRHDHARRRHRRRGHDKDHKAGIAHPHHREGWSCSLHSRFHLHHLLNKYLIVVCYRLNFIGSRLDGERYLAGLVVKRNGGMKFVLPQPSQGHMVSSPTAPATTKHDHGPDSRSW